MKNSIRDKLSLGLGMHFIFHIRKLSSALFFSYLMLIPQIAISGDVTILNKTGYDLWLTVFEPTGMSGDGYGDIPKYSEKTFQVTVVGNMILDVCSKKAWCGPGGTLKKKIHLGETGRMTWVIRQEDPQKLPDQYRWSE